MHFERIRTLLLQSIVFRFSRKSGMADFFELLSLYQFVYWLTTDRLKEAAELENRLKTDERERESRSHVKEMKGMEVAVTGQEKMGCARINSATCFRSPRIHPVNYSPCS